MDSACVTTADQIHGSLTVYEPPFPAFVHLIVDQRSEERIALTSRIAVERSGTATGSVRKDPMLLQ